MGAYAFGPSDEPEASAGWAFAAAAAVDHDVWVLCRSRFVDEIAERLGADATLAEHLHVVHIDLPDWVFRAKRHAWDLYWYYCLWQMLAARTAKRLHAELGFDLAHHVTFANDWLPSGLAGMPGVPFVWGPVGGASRLPIWKLRHWLGARGVAIEVARIGLTSLPRWIFGDSSARSASVVVAQNADVAHRFRRARRVVVEPNASLDRASLPERVPCATGGRRAVFVGRLIYWKGASLALEAMARKDARDWTLEIYGAGRERSALDALTSRLGLGDRVLFLGHRPRHEILESMARADILLFPSMHDQAGWVAAEASSMGTPVVCLPLGGPPTLAEPNAFTTSLHGDIVGNLVTTMNRAAATGGTPHDRWSSERLPALMSDWYNDARA
ncbi:glycosyltransferase [Tessaracoccus antarcticus]|nr:glycosyltransferase [Tessaracoccus antarcticus]